MKYYWKHGFQRTSRFRWDTAAFDIRFGIYAKFCVIYSRTFLGAYVHFLLKFRNPVQISVKARFCCPLLIRVLSDRTKGTIEKSMFESTYHESLAFFLFFLSTKCPTPFFAVRVRRAQEHGLSSARSSSILDITRIGSRSSMKKSRRIDGMTFLIRGQVFFNDLHLNKPVQSSY